MIAGCNCEACQKNRDYVFPRNFRRTPGFHWVNPGCLLQDDDEIFHNGYHEKEPCPRCGKIRWHGEKGECLKCIDAQNPRKPGGVNVVWSEARQRWEAGRWNPESNEYEVNNEAHQ